MAVVAVLGAIIWSVLDRRRTNYQTLYYWLTAIVRYYLAFTLFLFALEKFFKMQFPDLGLLYIDRTGGRYVAYEFGLGFFWIFLWIQHFYGHSRKRCIVPAVPQNNDVWCHSYISDPCQRDGRKLQL